MVHITLKNLTLPSAYKIYLRNSTSNNPLKPTFGSNDKDKLYKLYEQAMKVLQETRSISNNKVTKIKEAINVIQKSNQNKIVKIYYPQRPHPLNTQVRKIQNTYKKSKQMKAFENTNLAKKLSQNELGIIYKKLLKLK